MIEFENSAVGRVVRRLRKEKGLSQEVFSGLAGIARSHLAMIENGTKKPNFETIWRIANAFDLPPISWCACGRRNPEGAGNRAEIKPYCKSITVDTRSTQFVPVPLKRITPTGKAKPLC